MDEAKRILEAKKLAAGPLGQQLGKFPLLFASSVLFGQRPSMGRASKISSGSVSLVDFGQGPLAVTCEHVIAGYREMKEVYGDVVFQIGDAILDPLEQLIDENARLDLATIQLTETQAKTITTGGLLGSCVFGRRNGPLSR